MINSELLGFIRKRLEEGAAPQEIESELITQGNWAEQDVIEAFREVFESTQEQDSDNFVEQQPSIQKQEVAEPHSNSKLLIVLGVVASALVLTIVSLLFIPKQFLSTGNQLGLVEPVSINEIETREGEGVVGGSDDVIQGVDPKDLPETDQQSSSTEKKNVTSTGQTPNTQTAQQSSESLYKEPRRLISEITEVIPSGDGCMSTVEPSGAVAVVCFSDGYLKSSTEVTLRSYNRAPSEYPSDLRPVGNFVEVEIPASALALDSTEGTLTIGVTGSESDNTMMALVTIYLDDSESRAFTTNYHPKYEDAVSVQMSYFPDLFQKHGSVPLTIRVSMHPLEFFRDNALISGQEYNEGEAYVKRELNTLRVLAELYYDANGGSFLGMCATSDSNGLATRIKELKDEVPTSNPKCFDSATKYAIEATLSDGSLQCVDSMGTERTISSGGSVASALSCY